MLKMSELKLMFGQNNLAETNGFEQTIYHHLERFNSMEDEAAEKWLNKKDLIINAIINA